MEAEKKTVVEVSALEGGLEDLHGVLELPNDGDRAGRTDFDPVAVVVARGAEADPCEDVSLGVEFDEESVVGTDGLDRRGAEEDLVLEATCDVAVSGRIDGDPIPAIPTRRAKRTRPERCAVGIELGGKGVAVAHRAEGERADL